MAKANSYTEMGDVYNGEFKNGQMTSEGKLIFKFKELSRYQNDTQNPKKDIQDDDLKKLNQINDKHPADDHFVNSNTDNQNAFTSIVGYEHESNLIGVNSHFYLCNQND